MSRNPYVVAGGDPTLRESVFVFMDVLGFSSLITQARSNHTEQAVLRSLHGALSEGREHLDGKGFRSTSEMVGDKELHALKAFTDNIVIGWPIRSDGEIEIGSAFSRLAMFQLEMAMAGYFVRGAISVGPAYVDDFAVFGDALLQAYEGERTLARDPRIILTASAVEAVKSHLSYYSPTIIAPQVDDILKDTDGQWFLNYLDCIMMARDEVGPFYDEFLRHKSAVEKKLSEHASNPPVWAKYAWVAAYHNDFCDMHRNHFDAEHRVNIDLFAGKRSRIVDETDGVIS